MPPLPWAMLEAWGVVPKWLSIRLLGCHRKTPSKIETQTGPKWQSNVLSVIFQMVSSIRRISNLTWSASVGRKHRVGMNCCAPSVSSSYPRLVPERPMNVVPNGNACGMLANRRSFWNWQRLQPAMSVPCWIKTKKSVSTPGSHLNPMWQPSFWIRLMN